MRGSAKYPSERRCTDEQFQFHTTNPALVSSVYSPPVSPVKGGKGVKGEPGNDWKKEARRPLQIHSQNGQKYCSTE